ncbi:anti-sigma factor [Opitutaceae bacterium EW11]|nr:anti-sigma factor [Opitutaceae bacterium EW11]
MDCNEIRRLLEAATDGELDVAHQLAVEEHLGRCPLCARAVEGIHARRTALQTALPRFTAPPALAEKVRSALRNEGAPVRTSASQSKRADVFPLWRVTGLAASLAMALFVGYTWGGSRVRTQALVDEAVSDHVRSLQANHLMDVASTDQHTVKPWFAGKLAFSPPVTDLAGVGFPLVGGRLERVAGQDAAALVYRRRQHAINLFIWPARREAAPPVTRERDGYNVVSWTDGSFNFLAVSEIPAVELADFAEEIRQATP